MVLPGRHLALSRARRKTSGREEKIKIDRPHSSLPGLELARGSIAYGPEVRAGGKAGANDCGVVDGAELVMGSSGPVFHPNCREPHVPRLAIAEDIGEDLRRDRSRRAREAHVRSQAISCLIKVVFGTIGRRFVRPLDASALAPASLDRVDQSRAGDVADGEPGPGTDARPHFRSSRLLASLNLNSTRSASLP